MNIDFNNISKQTIERYNSRLDIHGKNIKTLGWGSVEQQDYRFLNIATTLNLENKNVLDIGCGFGDLYNFLIKNGIRPSSYTGWDLNKSLLENANNIGDSTVNYNVIDITKNLIDYENHFNAGIMLGLLNYNLKSSELNYEYSKKLIKNSFGVVNEFLVVDFLSSHLNPTYPKEDFVFYHDPLVMLEYAFTLTPNVVLKHNYAPIPQKEFMLYLYK